MEDENFILIWLHTLTIFYKISKSVSLYFGVFFGKFKTVKEESQAG